MRLIDADVLINKAWDVLMDKAWDTKNGFVWEKIVSIKDVADAPTIDAVPVVRCRDCKWYDKHDKRCKVWNHGVLSIGYCYRGEEREDETAD